MAMTATYTTFGGVIVHEVRSGTERFYAPDTLGSTQTLHDATGAVTDTFDYWPYGETKSRTGTTDTPFTFVGTLGYYADAATRMYVRARYYLGQLARWQTVDPIWPMESTYGYLTEGPVSQVDPTGLSKALTGCLTCYTGSEGFRDKPTFCGKKFTEELECSPSAAALGGAIKKGWKCGAKVRCCIVKKGRTICQVFTITDSGRMEEPILDLGCCWAKKNGWIGFNDGRVPATCELLEQGSGSNCLPPKKDKKGHPRWKHLPGPC